MLKGAKAAPTVAIFLMEPFKFNKVFKLLASLEASVDPVGATFGFPMFVGFNSPISDKATMFLTS